LIEAICPGVWLGKTIFGEATSFFIPLDLPFIQAVFGEGV
jgi:hypothetical protein